jgi:tRNA threonylcarbamoyladenosine biosynthesis protein TsaE
MMFSITIDSTGQLAEAATKFLEAFPYDRIFAFYGKMGAGKTTFIKALCRSMGSTDNITSPTFALVNEYDTSGPSKIYHFDFYRVRNPEEALDIGLDEYLYSDQYCFMEWPEKIESLLPEDLVEVHIEEQSQEVRQIKAFHR